MREQGHRQGRRAKSKIRIQIFDTEVGILKKVLAKIFEPLFTTRAKGIGLGLALTKALVDGLGGTIEVEGKVEKGAALL